MQKVLSDDKEINQRVYVFPTSAILEDGKKLSYFDYISSLQNKDCNEALKRISGRIDIDKISHMIEEAPSVTEVQKDFYKAMISERKARILDYSMELLLKLELSLGEKQGSSGQPPELTM